MQHSVFITGSNRGIGLEFVKQFAQKNWIVYASCRNPAKASALNRISRKNTNIHILKLDVCSEKDIHNLKKKFNNKPIDCLINNAGILDKKRISFNKLTSADFMKIFSVNSVAPFLITRALLPNLELGKLKVVASLSSIISSLTENYGGRWNHYNYKASKAALNMVMSCFALEPNYMNFKVVILDPGWVRTDMGGNDATLSPEESVSGMIKVLCSKKLKSRIFINYLGKRQAW